MQAKIRFLLKFLVLISVLLPLWLIGAAPHYLRWIGEESAVVLRALGYTILGVESDATRLYLQVDLQNKVNFEAVLATLNTIMYVSLLLSSTGAPWRRRLAFFFIGLLVLNLSHVLYVVAHFYVGFHYEPHSRVAEVLRSVSEVVYLLLPVMLWALFEAPRLFRPMRRAPAAA